MSHNINCQTDVATSEPQTSVVAEDKNQKEGQDQVPKDVKDEQENTAQIKVIKKQLILWYNFHAH